MRGFKLKEAPVRLSLFGAVLAFLVISGAPAANAVTDYTCMQDCQEQGYLYRYCKSQCSYGAGGGGGNDNFMGGTGSILPDPAPRARSTDYKCMSDCSSLGYQYGYCKELCSY